MPAVSGITNYPGREAHQSRASSLAALLSVAGARDQSVVLRVWRNNADQPDALCLTARPAAHPLQGPRRACASAAGVSQPRPGGNAA
jgi:hypothetical protein